MLGQTKTALSPGFQASFGGQGGTAPYTYSVRPHGAGGAINSSTGLYTAPLLSPEEADKSYDTIQVKDSSVPPLVTTSQILVGTPLVLFCDIIQKYMGLAPGRVYLWDQKIFEPTDSGIFVAVSVLRCKPFGNNSEYDGSGDGLSAFQTVNMYADLQVDIISRGSGARDRKEEIILALMSDYAQQQQEANSFYIGKIPPAGQFVNVSQADGAAIPYRFNIIVGMQYAYRKVVDVGYFDTFTNPPPVITES